MTEPPHAELEESEGVLTVVFTRDDKLNAISPQMTQTLWDAVQAVRDRDDLRALLITARGRFFSAGIDLKAAPGPDQLRTGSAFRRYYRQHHLLYDEIEALEKPVFLAAQGPCLGAGVELAASCDFRFAASSAFFQLPEVGLGMVPGSGGVSRLTRLVGPHWAKWIAVAARRVDASKAESIGFVHEVLADDGFHSAVDTLVREIIALPAEALGAAKLAVNMASEVDRRTARDIERLANSYLYFTGDFSAAGASIGRGV